MTMGRSSAALPPIVAADWPIRTVNNAFFRVRRSIRFMAQTLQIIGTARLAVSRTLTMGSGSREPGRDLA